MSKDAKLQRYYAEERKRIIMEQLKQHSSVEVRALSTLLHTSAVTIREDLSRLEQEGKLMRTHGGAVINDQKAFEYIFPEEVTNLSKKQAIARYALGLISDGNTIVLDTGSTTNELARLLGAKRNLTVVLYDIHIAELLERTCEANIILLGGSLRRGLHSTVGPIATGTMAGLRVDKAFITTGAINPDGLATSDIYEAEIKAAAMRSAAEVYVLADSDKFDRVAFNHFAGFEGIRALITDDGLTDGKCEMYTKLGLGIVRINE